MRSSKKPVKSERKQFDVITIGGATRDVFVRSSHFENIPSDSAPDGWNACLPLGAKIPIDELVFETGGGATNAAVTFAQMGNRVACVSRIGKDAGGCELVSRLHDAGVDTRAMQVDPKERTAYSFILLAGTGSRTILVSRGASQRLDPNDVPWRSLEANWLYLTSLGGDVAALKAVFAHAKQELVHVAWNPGNAELELGLKKLLPLAMQSDVLILNLQEAAGLADTSPRHLEKILRALGALPRVALVITDGKRGAYAHARGVTWHVEPLKGKIVNTTGAGDAFGSGFVASLMQDGDIEKALKVGTLNAHGVITHMGAKTGILKKFPTARELARINVKELR